MENQKVRTSFKGVILLLITAFVWGTSFLAQRFGTDSGVEPFTFQGIRTLLGSIFLLPFIFVKDFSSAKKMSPEEKIEKKKINRKTWIYGTIIGIALCLATNFQQYAFLYEPSAGKIAFVTAMYMFFVPIAGLFFRKRLPIITWICVIIGFIGLYFLCVFKEGFGSINFGDILAFFCAIFFCVQILLVEKFAPECDGVKLSCIQFFVAGGISLILMFIFDSPKLPALKDALIPIIYSGVMSCGVAYTLQIVGQKYCEATIASLLMCMESVFAVLSEAVVIPETKLAGSEIAGCIIMFAAILLSQFADIMRARKTK